MKTFKDLLESKKSTVVVAFGRMNPVTSGHELLAKAVASIATKNNADHIIYLSKSQDSKKNPLNVNQKVFYARQSFKSMNIVGADDRIRTFIEVAASLTGKYDNLIMVAGSDRVIEYKQLLDKYNGKDFKFKSILVVSAGERDPDADSASGMSATKMRQAAVDNNFSKFKQGVPTGMTPVIAKKMFDDVRTGMKLNEAASEVREQYVKHEIFNVGDYVVYQGEEDTIVHRGSNYVILENKKRAWLNLLTPTNKVNETIMVKEKDKIKAARIIGMALGYEDAANKTDPSSIVNSALRVIRNKPLNSEAKKILKRMLELAKQMEIKYDEKLIDLAESAAQDAEDAEEEIEKLIHEPRKDVDSVYSRLRKIHLNFHESEDGEEDDGEEDDGEEDDGEEDDEDMDDEVDKHLESITDDDIIEHGYEDDEFEVVDDETGEVVESYENSVQLQEVLSRMERMRAKVRMKKSEAKRQRAIKISLKRRSSGATIAKRARRIAVKTLEAKIARKPLNQLSVTEKERVEKRIAMMGPRITKIATKLLARVRATEKARLHSSNTKK